MAVILFVGVSAAAGIGQLRAAGACGAAGPCRKPGSTCRFLVEDENHCRIRLSTMSRCRVKSPLGDGWSDREPVRGCGGETVARLASVRGRSADDPAAWRHVQSGAGAAVHAAALRAPHAGVRSGEEFRQVDVGATRDLPASSAAGAGRFGCTSSTSVYGYASESADEAVRGTGDVACRPRDVYDETKLAAERLALLAAGAMSTASLRIARCFPEPPAVRARRRLHRGVDTADVTDAHLLAVQGPGERPGC
ncbi:NAD-dependent epimerase/dehydratase family protein [Kitasatospora sp. NPDC056138]|uniref:NAD-dependent epimerase/dehydratase family protein n=1 Tax=Kitasatospora sp. NPDC056138 TaxID=3345724 RepID=UPI0035DDC6B0